MKQKKVARFHLGEEKRVISFEEYKEIHQMQEGAWTEQSAEEMPRYTDYQNKDLNLIAEAIEKVVQRWDFKKEKFSRYRLCAFMSEERKDASVRQNTSYYMLSQQKAEEAKLMKQVIKMLHYLPDTLAFFQEYPL